MSIQRLTIIGALFAVLAGVNQMVLASEPSSEAAKVALRSKGFPWYDVKKDEFRPMAPTKEAEPAPEKPAKNPETSNGDRTFLQTFQMLLMWGFLIAVLAVVAIISFRTMQDALQDSSTNTATAAVSLETLEALPEPVRKVQDLLGEATRLASMSAFEPAMMFYYSWQLVQLDRHHAIELQKGKTNRQYQREISASAPELMDLFSVSLRLFEDAFFGQLPVSHDDFMQVWEQRHRFQFTEGSRRS